MPDNDAGNRAITFHYHLDTCQQCSQHPHDLCPTGAKLLMETAGFADAGYPTTAAQTCQHCFCRITTGGDLRCHKCYVTKPYEDPKPQTCLMCNGTGITYQARSHDSDFESEPAL